MRLGRKIILFFILCFVSCWFLVAPAQASNEFATSYHITYTVNQDASMLVQQNITLENKLASIYATEYQINLGATQISGLTAWDEQGTISPQIEKQANTTQINLKFNQKVVGKGEKLQFGLSFLTPDFAFLNGQVLQIGIPRLADSQSLTDYQITLKIPQSFEEPIFINPEPQNQQKLADYNIYTFNQSQLADQSVFASFGEKQFMDFQLNYDLNNTEPGPRIFEIALPPETSWQKIVLNTLNPQPENVKVDADGNWLAEYILESGQNLNVLATGSATLYLQPQPIKLALAKDMASLLQTQEYWPTQAEAIRSLASQLSTIEEIYDYVVQTLTYDYNKVNGQPQRMGALKALANPDQTVCMEFTDLLVTLARAAGIPAREINGYAYTQNPRLRPSSSDINVLHSWPEYFDQEKKLWIPLDPTWENTSGLDFFHHFDLSHLALVIHGQDSQYPMPHGQLEVAFSQPALEQEKISLNIDAPAQALAGFNIKAKVKIKNSGNVALADETYGLIPPFGSYEQEIDLEKSSLWAHGPTVFNFQFGNEQRQVTINLISPLLAWVLPLGVAVALALALFVVFLKVRKRKSVLPKVDEIKRSQL